jgi:hypothetical protein
MKRTRLPALAATLCLALIGLAVPVLEINTTHLLNPQWPPHARLHEAWQLITNSGLSLLGVVLIWRHERVFDACIIGQFLSGGFVLAWLARGSFGGSMGGASTGATTIAGLDLALWTMLIVFATFTAVAIASRARPTLKR